MEADSVIDNALIIAHKRGIAPQRLRSLEDACHNVAATKRLSGLTVSEKALVALERALSSSRRLSHQTGAENWL
jgi:hypothetical protein